MADCIFCKIVQDEIPATVLHEDDQALAFLDIAPLRHGHTLVVPKRHAARVAELDASDAAALMTTTHRLVPAIGQAVDAPDATIAINDGPSAGQEVPHVHLHIVPRRPADGAGPIHALFRDPSDEARQEEPETLAERIRAAL